MIALAVVAVVTAAVVVVVRVLIHPSVDYRDRYGDMAQTLGFEGHIAWAEAMP